MMLSFSALGLLSLRTRTAEGFALHSIMTVLIFAAAVAFILPSTSFNNTISAGEAVKDGVREALGLLKDTTQWLAGIQTATLAALGFLTKEGFTALKPNSVQLKLSILVAVLNSSALFFSAWVLTALPSIALRAHSDPTRYYDFFNLTIYPSLDEMEIGAERIFTVQFFAFCNHWLWALGVLLFGYLCVSIAISRSAMADRSRAGRRARSPRPAGR